MTFPSFLKFAFFARKLPPATPEEHEAEAQNKRGMLYYTGSRDRPDFPAALKCFRAAAEAGHAAAQNSLAMMLSIGQGTPRDPEQAHYWLLRAAAQGDANAQFNLGARCHRANIRGATPAREKRSEALMWFQLAADHGHPKADEWCERLRLDMTSAEVAESERRIAAFVPRKELGSPPNP